MKIEILNYFISCLIFVCLQQAIREAAVSALRACLELTAQRETKEMQKPQWYKVSTVEKKSCTFGVLITYLCEFNSQISIVT